VNTLPRPLLDPRRHLGARPQTAIDGVVQQSFGQILSHLLVERGLAAVVFAPVEQRLGAILVVVSHGAAHPVGATFADVGDVLCRAPLGLQHDRLPSQPLAGITARPEPVDQLFVR
jgi:hypothetical protein